MAKLLKDYLKECGPKLGIDPELEFKNAVKRYGEDTANKAMVFDSLISIEKKELDEDEPIVDVTVEIPDRSREVLLVSGARLANYRKNPIMLSGHRYAPEFTIGGSRWIKPGKTNWKGKEVNSLKAKTWFASTPFAQDHKTLIKERALRAFSHTFVPFEFIDDEDSIKELGFKAKDVNRIYTDYEILELGPVTIPDNPAALVSQKGAVESDYFKNMIRGYEGEEDNEEYETEAVSEEPYDKDTDTSIESMLIASTKFAGSPKNKYGTHSSKGFKGNYAAAWRCHFSKIGGGGLSGTASGPIRGTVRRTEMIAAVMKPPCSLPKTESIGARQGPKSPLKCTFPEKPSDYGLSSWAKPGDDNLKQEDIRLTCKDLAVIKKAALAEIKRRAADREKEEDGKKDLIKEETNSIWAEINAIKTELVEIKAIIKGKKGQEWNESSSGDLPEKEIAKVITDKLSDVLKFGMEELTKPEV